MRPKSALILGMSLVLAGCTSGPRPPAGVSSDATPSGATSPSPSGTPHPSRNVIPLPPLPTMGFAAMWSRANNKNGVSLLTMDGHIVASVPNVIIWDPNGPGGRVILRSWDKRRYWFLDTSAHRLIPVTQGGAKKLLQQPPRSRLPIPARSVGSWAWSVPAPSGTGVLAQYYQNGYGSELSECAKPLAMLQSTPGADLTPVTGDPLGAAQPSYALGWTAKSEPVVAVGKGPCGGPPGGLRDGIYVFGSHGEASPVPVPKGSYFFQMWASEPSSRTT